MSEMNAMEKLAAKVAELEAKLAANESKVSSRKKMTEEDEKVIEDYRAKVLGVAKKAGLTCLTRAAWVKILRNGFARPRMDFTREGRVHCIGFRVDGVTEVSEAEAKKAHLGFVRGYVDYTDPKFTEVVDRMVKHIIANAK